MTWTCENCHRTFKYKNQSHSCMQVDLDEFLQRSDPVIQKLCKKTIETIQQFGKVEVSPVKNAIIISSNSTFCALKPARKWLNLEFVLDQPVDEFPIYKVMQVSKYRFAHFIRLENNEELDEQLVKWLKESYTLIDS